MEEHWSSREWKSIGVAGSREGVNIASNLGTENNRVLFSIG